MHDVAVSLSPSKSLLNVTHAHENASEHLKNFFGHFDKFIFQ